MLLLFPSVISGVWPSVSALGDSAVLIPCAAIVAIWLLSFRETRTIGLQWLGLFALVAGLVVATKLVFLIWGVGVRSLDFTGLSGHSAMSAFVWPSLLSLLITRCRWAAVRHIAFLTGLLLAVGIAYSRVAVHAHSFAEAASGFLIGAAVGLIILRGFQPFRSVARYTLAPVLVILTIVPFVYGLHFPSEKILRSLAFFITGESTFHSRGKF